MATYNGTLILLKADDAGGSPTALAVVQDASLTLSQDLFDTSTKDSAGWADHGRGQRSWSVSVNGLAQWNSTTDNVKLFTDWILNRDAIDIEFEPDTTSADVTGSVVSLQGEASLANVEISAPNEDISTISGEFTGNGVLSSVIIS